MTKEAIREALDTQPFKPFAMRLADGLLIPVPHPDFVFLTQGGRTAIVNTEGERIKILDTALITALELDERPH